MSALGDLRYGERSEDVRCPVHDKPLALLEEGVLNGTRVTWWGLCPGEERQIPARTCAFHAYYGPDERMDYCRCRPASQSPACERTVRREEITHVEPELFAEGSEV